MYTQDKALLSLANKVTGLNKRSAKIEGTLTVHISGRNWGGGYKNDYYVVDLATGKSARDTYPDWNYADSMNLPLKPGFAIICLHYMGCSKGLTVYVHPSNLIQALEKPVELTQNERIVLCFTRSYKNTYGGRKNVRFLEATYKTKIPRASWEESKQSLILRKLLNKAGSLTIHGRNAAENLNEMDF